MYKTLLLIIIAAICSAQFLSENFTTFKFGGNGEDGTFTYAGEGTGQCSGDICRGGVCSETAPNGICTLTSVATNLVMDDENGGVSGVVYNYYRWTHSAGTVAFGSTPSDFGLMVWLWVKDKLIQSGGTVDLKGKGGKGSVGGTVVCSTNGTRSGVNFYAAGFKTGGDSGAPTGKDGLGGSIGGNAYWRNTQITNRLVWFPGTGGGTNPVSGQVLAADFRLRPVLSTGGGGGSGGYCGASCSGTTGDGGRGGGGLYVEANAIEHSGGTIDVRGNDGTNGSAAGGGGNVLLLAKNILASSGTILLDGGVAGGSVPTNCNAGGNGSLGDSLYGVIP